MITREEYEQMEIKGFENYDKEALTPAFVYSKLAEKRYSSNRKQIKAIMCDQMESGEQMSLALSDTEYTITKAEVDTIGFDCDESLIYSTCLKTGQSLYLKNSVNTTAIKKDYLNGTLHPDIAAHIVVSKQLSMNESKSKIKEVK
jgi:hypothetical protein